MLASRQSTCANILAARYCNPGNLSSWRHSGSGTSGTRVENVHSGRVLDVVKVLSMPRDKTAFLFVVSLRLKAARNREMSLTLDLPEDLENELSAEAAQLGLTLPEYVLRVLSTGFTVDEKPKTGAELVEYWRSHGLVGARTDVTDSRLLAREIREQAERERQA